MSDQKTDIYEDKTFFGDYLESTSEKDTFVDIFVKKVAEKKIESLLDLGCFDGSLTRKLVSQLIKNGVGLNRVTAVEPARAPLEEFESTASAIDVTWQFKNLDMQAFLNSRRESFDWVIASHSLYWMGDSHKLIGDIVDSARNGVIVIRDPGLLHWVEAKYRPLMTKKTKRFISSREIGESLDMVNAPFKCESFAASMAVPDATSAEFKQLAGFLLDLTLDEIDESLLAELYSDLEVRNGRARYGIDLIWFGAVLKK
jgi:SAM-dependent methyltransferase